MDAAPRNIGVLMFLLIHRFETFPAGRLMTNKGLIGQPLARSEDFRLLTGAGRYSDDETREDIAHAVMVRSNNAHASILNIRTEEAKSKSGVLGIFTGQDWLDDGLGPMPAWGNPKDVELKNSDGREIFYTPLWPVAVDRVRRVGEIFAVVIAKTESQARDAMELISVDLNSLEPAIEPLKASSSAACELWSEIPKNLNVSDVKGNRDVTDELFSQARHIVDLEIVNQRVTGVPMEPRAALAEYEPNTDSFLIEAGGQGVIRFRNELSATFGLDPSKVRVISRDVGGGYGTRNHTYPEFALVMWAAKRLGMPVKWNCSRSEAFLSDYAGRDLETEASIALDQDGRILAMRSYNTGNLGTHTVSYVPIARGPTVYNGVYDIPVADIKTKAVMTNTTVTASYRGAGRPESMFVIERLMDLAAKKMGIDRIELRRLNLIDPSAIPYTNGVGVVYDSGNFARSMDMALEKADWFGFPKRRLRSEANGLLRGIGLANYIETATGYPQERAEMYVNPEGTVEIVIGTQSSGQGHETTFPQIVADWLGISVSAIWLKTGDTDFVAAGSGSHSSRSMRLAGHLFRQTSDRIIEKGRLIAAHCLEAAPTDIGYAGGQFSVSGTDRKLSLFEIAGSAEQRDDLPKGLDGPLQAVAEISGPLPAYPNGCHVAEIEIDPETGVVEIIKYTGIDDVGRIVNPLIVDGQTHGGIVQGVGQALMEKCAYDESGQLITGSFMDYAMPRAESVPSFDLGFNEIIAASTFLGVKGGGEGGTTAAPPALVNAICDALADFDVDHLEMPVTSEKVWAAIQRRHS
jgi:carbon-monoxide dehydrogenase large subunit